MHELIYKLKRLDELFAGKDVFDEYKFTIDDFVDNCKIRLRELELNCFEGSDDTSMDSDSPPDLDSEAEDKPKPEQPKIIVEEKAAIMPKANRHKAHGTLL